jgi:hypothetical protein
MEDVSSFGKEMIFRHRNWPISAFCRRQLLEVTLRAWNFVARSDKPLATSADRLKLDTEFAVPCNKFWRALAARSQKSTPKYLRDERRRAKVVGVNAC